MKQPGTNSSPRRTLPAPSEPLDINAIVAERDRLRFEVGSLHSELGHLRSELARLRDERRMPSLDLEDDLEIPESGNRLPLPSALPLPPRVAREEPRPKGVMGALYTPSAVPTGAPKPYAPPPMAEGFDFGAVSRLSPEELDTLPYSLVCLDANGRVIHYNDTESRMARLPKSRVVGRNFFLEVAPCARVREFEGQFRELVRDPLRVRVRSFDFIFRFEHSEQHVTIVITPARTRGQYNLAILRRSVVAHP